uniref:Small ribosomal subunit protein uS3c n=1 Tax=Epirixanthes elongata TaxID=1562316 RepID=A0A6B7FLM1_EPIEO|nr:ribosomal protein S3 [Epirixanthes elongata]QBB73114.1 ribosomal protein S3 [Epirixanthes elongata]
MGQKVNPLVLRLGTTQSYHSLWFEQPKAYSKGLQEDKKIRNSIKNYVQKKIRIYSEREGIVCIKIQKGIDEIRVIISLVFQKFFKKDLEELQRNVQKELNQKLRITITQIGNPYGHPNILSKFIAGQLKNRVSFRKAMKKAIKLTQGAGTDGVKIQIAGRIDGKDIARVEWVREGRVPLHNVRAKIDYCSSAVRTLYGVLGIKIWKFVNESL